jgi:chromosomal replication initiator protein
MMEDCAPGMPISQGCTDDSDVIELFKEALKQRVGEERFQIWFSGVRFEAVPDSLTESEGAEVICQRSIVAFVHGQFAADRLAKDYLSAMRGAAASACGQATPVRIDVDIRAARQVELPFAADGSANDTTVSDGSATHRGPEQTSAGRHLAAAGMPQDANQASRPTGSGPSGTARSGSGQLGISRKTGSGNRAQSLHSILRDGTDSRSSSRSKRARHTKKSIESDSEKTDLASDAKNSSTATATAAGTAAGGSRHDCTWENFIAGDCNELARTACKMAIENPALASPLVLWGPPGSGKTHLLSAVAGKLRGLHRMRRVVYLSAEEFTNDFLKALHANCLPAFRSRFRDADALIIDDIQFFIDKKATMRELHHTIELLAEAGKPLVFAGTKAPTEIKGLGGELSGRLASGLVCQVESLDAQSRTELLSRYAKQRCLVPWPDETLKEIGNVASGDGRLLSGIVNLVALLQRMHGQMPSIDQIRQHGGHLLRSSGVPVTLSAIERAVEKTFQLDSKSLQSSSQIKSITEPRMLAMYLSRELTSSAFSEIGGHFGGRSHSTAILANQRVRQWLDAGRAIGRGQAALSTDEAIRRIESMLKTG